MSPQPEKGRGAAAGRRTGWAGSRPVRTLKAPASGDWEARAPPPLAHARGAPLGPESRGLTPRTRPGPHTPHLSGRPDPRPSEPRPQTFPLPEPRPLHTLSPPPGRVRRARALWRPCFLSSVRSLLLGSSRRAASARGAGARAQSRLAPPG